LSADVNPLPRRLERVVYEIACELEAQLPSLAAQWYERMSDFAELDPWGTREIHEVALENARRDMGREISGLLAGRALPDSCPAEVTESARLAAGAEFPLWACIQSYRAGHAVQWQAYSDAVETRRLDRTGRRLVLTAGSDYMFAYADLCSRWVELEYTRERDRRLRSQEQMRIQLVRDLLEGRSVDARPLGYGLDGWHVALVGSGREAERVLRELGQDIGAELLMLAADPRTWWGWARLDDSDASGLERRWRRLSLPSGSSLAAGEPGHGAAGFRASHQQAQYALAIAVHRGRAATRYREVALEALAMVDRAQAQAFVTRELGPLASDDKRSRTLRETLRAYFAASLRASSTAAMLGVHERTIGNRLRSIEGMIDHAVHVRRAELDVALRIWDLVFTREPRDAPVEPPPLVALPRASAGAGEPSEGPRSERAERR
jgi:PucR C-terminal helix-turn-helix domain/GGDEF-like domain